MRDRIEKAYRRATEQNGYLVSLGGGVLPWPTLEQYRELDGNVTPNWQHWLHLRAEKRVDVR